MRTKKNNPKHYEAIPQQQSTQERKRKYDEAGLTYTTIKDENGKKCTVVKDKETKKEVFRREGYSRKLPSDVHRTKNTVQWFDDGVVDKKTRKTTYPTESSRKQPIKVVEVHYLAQRGTGKNKKYVRGVSSSTAYKSDKYRAQQEESAKKKINDYDYEDVIITNVRIRKIIRG